MNIVIELPFIGQYSYVVLLVSICYCVTEPSCSITAQAYYVVRIVQNLNYVGSP